MLAFFTWATPALAGQPGKNTKKQVKIITISDDGQGGTDTLINVEELKEFPMGELHRFRRFAPDALPDTGNVAGESEKKEVEAIVVMKEDSGREPFIWRAFDSSRGNVINLADPGIISYKKKKLSGGREKITIIRKEPPPQEARPGFPRRGAPGDSIRFRGMYPPREMRTREIWMENKKPEGK